MEDPRPPRTSLLTALRGVFGASPIPRMALRMPGKSHKGPLPGLTDVQRELAGELRRDVEHLAGNIGERNVFTLSKFREAEEWLGLQLQRAGYRVRRQVFMAMGVECVNLDVEIRGSKRPDEIVVFGAHYDSVRGCPAANDNGTGVAAVIALARRLAHSAPERTLRFVLWANEEPPFFWTEEMGSLVYAKACKESRENIVAMLTPETIGCYTDVEHTQDYPIPVHSVYPTTGNFIAFVGLYECGGAELVRRCVGAFRRECAFPSIGAGLPAIVPLAGGSDHWSFWKCGYPALMVTDTAPFRYTHYHTKNDTPEKLEYEKMARVVEGLGRVVRELAS
jgi:hypothetical protein